MMDKGIKKKLAIALAIYSFNHEVFDFAIGSELISIFRAFIATMSLSTITMDKIYEINSLLFLTITNSNHMKDLRDCCARKKLLLGTEKRRNSSVDTWSLRFVFFFFYGKTS